MVELLCPSKVNIVLKVLDRREDGYHDLVSIFLPLKNPHDKLYIERVGKKGLNLKCNIKELEYNNIIHKAYVLFGESTGLWPGLNVSLEKNIPIGSGLGGGSSDAATLLKFLGNYLKCEHKEKVLLDIAKRCGADVPFFLKSKPALVQGIGDKIKEIQVNFHRQYIIVLCPQICISTKWAYRELDKKRETLDSNSLTIDTFEIKNMTHFGYRWWSNDFEDVVLGTYPDLLKIKSRCYMLGARACVLSGSGSAMVALFTGLDSINMVKNFFEQRGLRVFVNKGV